MTSRRYVVVSSGGIHVEQALHGYMEGHRLLASSVELPKAALRTMLVLSDMSGSNLARGFESYVTGYPVEGTEFYAFAKTWYAHEMSRPGCAWTHTLLIRFGDMGKIPDLGILMSAFRRPDGGGIATNLYKGAIQIPPGWPHDLENRSHLDTHLPMSTVSHLVEQLYGDPQAPPILILCDFAHECEDLVVSLWSQQWPALRICFTFCSGSLANRSIGEKPFDLQVIPRKLARSIEREIPVARSIDIDTAPMSEVQHEWIGIVTEDIICRANTDFRRYLWTVGEISHPRRTDIEKLASLYGAIRQVDEGKSALGILLSELAARYPDAEDGRTVKGAILGPRTKGHDALIHNISESDMLIALAHCDHSASFSAEPLQVRSRAGALWREDVAFQGRVCELLSAHVNPLTEELLKGVADVISPLDVVRLSRGDYRIVFSFVERKPTLACSAEVWVGEPDYQRELFDHARHATIAPEMIQEMVKAMLEAKADAVAREVYAEYGTPVLRAFLDWYNRRAEALLRSAYRCWIELIRKAPAETLDWIRENSCWRAELIETMVSELDPLSSAVQAHGSELWARVLEDLEGDMGDSTRRALAEFLLPLSLRNRGPVSEKLARFAFPIVHKAAANDSLSYEAWRRLDPILPRLSWWKSWDKCERLRRGMIEAGFPVRLYG